MTSENQGKIMMPNYYNYKVPDDVMGTNTEVFADHNFEEPCQILGVCALNDHYMGYSIELSVGRICLLVCSEEKCCEHFGSLMRIDDVPRDNTVEAFESLIGKNVSRVFIHAITLEFGTNLMSAQVAIDLFDSDKKLFASFLVFNEHVTYYERDVYLTIFGKARKLRI